MSNIFSPRTKKDALIRQNSKCASCEADISVLGKEGRVKHRFGEGAQAHHIKPIQCGGSKHLDNCVILCERCHYSAHVGGNYREKMIGLPSDFPHSRIPPFRH